MRFFTLNKNNRKHLPVEHTSFDAATKYVEHCLQATDNQHDTYEVLVKVAEVKRSPHPVQIKLSQGFYDA